MKKAVNTSIKRSGLTAEDGEHIEVTANKGRVKVAIAIKQGVEVVRSEPVSGRRLGSNNLWLNAEIEAEAPCENIPQGYIETGAELIDITRGLMMEVRNELRKNAANFEKKYNSTS